MTTLEEIIETAREYVIPAGQPLVGLLLVLAIFGLYVLATGLAGLIWPTPLPQLTMTEQVEREVAEERHQLRTKLRAENPVYRLAFLERYLRPLVEELGRLVTGVFSRLGLGRTAHQELERKLDLIGAGETVAGFYGQRFASGVVLVAVAVVMQLCGLLDLSLMGLAGTFTLGLLLPGLSLSHRVRRMREEALTQLPSFIDLLSINVQAGMGLEQAMLRVAIAGGSGTLPAAIRRAFSEAQYRNLLVQSKQSRRTLATGEAAALLAVGIEGETIYWSRTETGKSNQTQLTGTNPGRKGSSDNLTLLALSDMSQRFRLPELDDFVSAMETADRQGIPVTETLLGLAGMMREKRRTRLIEAGSKSTVRMLFPVALFIMPAFLLLLLTPALIEFMQLGS
jgi:Flp pilus assembly protein TadB